MVSHYFKFDLLKCNIITSKGSSVHQRVHAYDMVKENDLVYLSVLAIKEKKIFTSHLYQVLHFMKAWHFVSFLLKQTNKTKKNPMKQTSSKSSAKMTSCEWLCC